MTAYLNARAHCLHHARVFFEGRGYLEVETPVLVPSPGLDVHLDAFAVDAKAPHTYLATSPEYQMKRLVADGHARIYQLTRAFRRDESGVRHNPEFSILEFYRLGALSDVIADTEQLFARVLGGEVKLGERRIRVLPPFRRVTVAEAFAEHANMDEREMLRLAQEDEARFYEVLAFTVEPALARLDEAVILHRYPTPFASLARRCEDDPRYAERFEIYVAGWELCNGFGELTDVDEQRARFEQDQAERARRGLAVYPIDEQFLAALARGLPACAGNAVGFDRLVALAVGVGDVRSVMAFPSPRL
jgi:lysyl-tRNA synthetase class 2